MPIFNGLLVAAFLMLVAASVAVVGSMIVLALFDLAFGGKRRSPAAVEATEGDIDMVEPVEDMVEPVELNKPASNLRSDVEAPNDNVVPFKRTG
jgi:hypothetical protein